MIVGRDEQLTSFDLLLNRLMSGRTEQSMIITGHRGVGKTVLLGQFRTKALRAGWAVVEIEVRKHDDDQFTSEFAARLRTVLFELSPRERWSEKLREAAAVVRSFSLTVDPSGKVTAGLDVDAASGHSDHGNLTLDMTDVFVAIGEAAQSEGKGVVFLLDEVQFLESGVSISLPSPMRPFGVWCPQVWETGRFRADRQAGSLSWLLHRRRAPTGRAILPRG